MKRDDRSAAIAAYRERKSAPGIFAVRCATSGEAWVGHTPTLDTVRNRIWFTLKMGGHVDHGIQAAWRAHGADGFAFEVLERLEEEDEAHVRESLLKTRATHWRETLGAKAI